MENSGIYKKHCVQIVLYIMAMACALCCECVCAWAFSKPRQPGSQELYQSARPPCEMSSHSRRLWDCCRHPNALWMSASLTGQLAYTALLTTQLHFQLLFFNFFPPHLPNTAPLSGREDDKHYPETDSLNPCGRRIICVGGHVLRWTLGQCVLFKTTYDVRFFCSLWHIQDLCNMQPNTLHGIRTAELNSFAHKSSAPQYTGPA